MTDTGVSGYERTPARLYQRGTAAHSTVQIDGEDQSEVWAAFRMGRRARVREAELLSAPQLGLRAALSARLRSGRSVEHSRQLDVARRSLDFRDRLHAPGGHTATIRLHLAPGLRAKGSPGGMTIEDERSLELASVTGQGTPFRPDRSPYHPEFGVEIERTLLTAVLPFRDRLDAGWTIHHGRTASRERPHERS